MGGFFFFVCVCVDACAHAGENIKSFISKLISFITFGGGCGDSWYIFCVIIILYICRQIASGYFGVVFTFSYQSCLTESKAQTMYSMLTSY